MSFVSINTIYCDFLLFMPFICELPKQTSNRHKLFTILWNTRRNSYKYFPKVQRFEYPFSGSETKLSTVIPFFSSLQSFPASGPFLMSQLFASGGQRTVASASASVLSINIQDWFPLGLTALISLLSKGLSRVFSNTTVQKHQFFGTQLSLWSNSHIHTWPLEKP